MAGWAETLDPKAKHYLERVREAAQRMGELIDDLLELARVGRAELRRSETDLTQIARTVALELGKRDPDRQIAIEIQEGLVADADRRLIRVVLENLLGNGWKFTGGTERPRIEVGSTQGADGTVYFVRDNGAGFDMTYADKLFRPFHRLHSEVEYPGTGIGLATVHRIVDRHGGQVSAEGTVGGGATFYFSLPPSQFGVSHES
jgi:light-regulated signal transduction histidine kinase (bacteriophytochrome)